MARVVQFSGVATDEDGKQSLYTCSLIVSEDEWQMEFAWAGERPVRVVGNCPNVRSFLHPIIARRHSQMEPFPQPA